MDAYLLQAATSGDARKMKQLVGGDLAVLLGTTPMGNTCLHISSIYGHQQFCEDILNTYPSHVLSLLTAVNNDGETPLLVAVRSGHVALASYFLWWYRYHQLRESICEQDKLKCNALHHAISSSHKEFALELIEAESDLLRAVNEYNESPMFLAVMRDYEDVFERLLGISGSEHVGPGGYNVLHMLL
jgi:ankyrin repeat protein